MNISCLSDPSRRREAVLWTGFREKNLGAKAALFRSSRGARRSQGLVNPQVQRWSWLSDVDLGGVDTLSCGTSSRAFDLLGALAGSLELGNWILVPFLQPQASGEDPWFRSRSFSLAELRIAIGLPSTGLVAPVIPIFLTTSPFKPGVLISKANPLQHARFHRVISLGVRFSQFTDGSFLCSRSPHHHPFWRRPRCPTEGYRGRQRPCGS